MSGAVTCNGCGGWQHRGDGDGHPWGWYHVSVTVPAYMGKNGQPFLWAGMWCSAECLAASMDDLARQQLLARHAYEADPPLSGGLPARAENTIRS